MYFFRSKALVLFTISIFCLQTSVSYAATGAGAMPISEDPKETFLKTAQKSASCLLVYAPTGEEPQVLLGKRNYGGEHYADFGGLVDGEDAALETALRETVEESRGAYTPTADQVFELHNLSIYNNLFNFHGHRETHHTVYIHEVAEQKNPGSLAADTHESAEMTTYAWVNLKDLLSLRSPEEFKTRLGQAGALLPEFFMLLKQPQVHSKLQAYLSAHKHSAHAFNILPIPYYERSSSSIIKMHHKHPWAWEIVNPYQALTVSPDRIDVESKTWLQHTGLAVEWKSSDARESVQDILRWMNSMHPVLQTIKRMGIFIQNHETAVSTGQSNAAALPMTTSDAMARYHLKDAYVEGDDEGNRAKLIDIMNSTRPLPTGVEDTVSQLLKTSMERERAHADRIAIYHGTNGEVAFLYKLYEALCNLIMPSEKRHLMLRPFDKRFFSLMGIDDIVSTQNEDNNHLLCANISALHNFKDWGNSSMMYCIESKVAVRQNFQARLKQLFHALGIKLPAADVNALNTLYEQYFLLAEKHAYEDKRLSRGLMLQFFVDPERAAQNISLSHVGFGYLVPLLNVLPTPYTSTPTLHFIEEIRRGNTHALDDLLKSHPGVEEPFELMQVRASLDSAFLNDEHTLSYAEYYPPLTEDQHVLFFKRLKEALSGILHRNRSISASKFWYPFHHQFLALSHLLQNKANVKIKHAALDSEEAIGFLNEATPAEFVEYLEDHPGFLNKIISLPAKVLNISISNPETILNLSVKEVLMQLAISEEGFSGSDQSNIMKLLCKAMERHPEAFDIADPRMFFIAQRSPSIREILIKKGIIGATPIRVVNDKSNMFVSTYPSMLHVPSVLSELLEIIYDYQEKSLTPLGRLFSTKRFKKYVLSLTPPSLKDEMANSGNIYDLVIYGYIAFKQFLGWTQDEIKKFFSNVGPEGTAALFEVGLRINSREEALETLDVVRAEDFQGNWTGGDTYKSRSKKIIKFLDNILPMLPAEIQLETLQKLFARWAQSIGKDKITTCLTLPNGEAYLENNLNTLVELLEHYKPMGIYPPQEALFALSEVYIFYQDDIYEKVKRKGILKMLSMFEPTAEVITQMLEKPIHTMSPILTQWFARHKSLLTKEQIEKVLSKVNLSNPESVEERTMIRTAIGELLQSPMKIQIPTPCSNTILRLMEYDRDLLEGYKPLYIKQIIETSEVFWNETVGARLLDYVEDNPAAQDIILDKLVAPTLVNGYYLLKNPAEAEKLWAKVDKTIALLLAKYKNAFLQKIFEKLFSTHGYLSPMYKSETEKEKCFVYYQNFRKKYDFTPGLPANLLYNLSLTMDQDIWINQLENSHIDAKAVVEALSLLRGITPNFAICSWFLRCFPALPADAQATLLAQYVSQINHRLLLPSSSVDHDAHFGNLIETTQKAISALPEESQQRLRSSLFDTLIEHNNGAYTKNKENYALMALRAFHAKVLQGLPIAVSKETLRKILVFSKSTKEEVMVIATSYHPTNIEILEEVIGSLPKNLRYYNQNALLWIFDCCPGARSKFQACFVNVILSQITSILTMDPSPEGLRKAMDFVQAQTSFVTPAEAEEIRTQIQTKLREDTIYPVPIAQTTAFLKMLSSHSSATASTSTAASTHV